MYQTVRGNGGVNSSTRQIQVRGGGGGGGGGGGCTPTQKENTLLTYYTMHHGFSPCNSNNIKVLAPPLLNSCIC